MPWQEQLQKLFLLSSCIFLLPEGSSFQSLLKILARPGHALSLNSAISSTESLFVNEGESDGISAGKAALRDLATEERHLRFSGVGKLYHSKPTKKQKSQGSDKDLAPASHIEIVERLASSTVAVIGLGGVGSWAAEALCRSGVGNLLLVDLDDICISNTNRQLHALSSTVGKMKIDEMKRRLIDINPQCNITLIHDFVSMDNVYEIIDKTFNLTAVLDAMDGTQEKTALLAACVDKRIPIVTCGAAAGRIDPTKIIVEDLTKVSNDRLLAACRRNLRKFYDFEEGISFEEARKKTKTIKRWNILAVSSSEPPRQVCQSDTSSFRRCDGPLGTACFVTGTYGFVAASQIVEMIANNKFRRPRRQGSHPVAYTANLTSEST